MLLTALLGIFALAASAADVTGKWTAEVPGRGGNMQTNTFVFKADGSKLTGTLSGGRGGDVEITDGKIDGDNISFVVVRSFGGNTVKQLFKGTVSGDTIKFTRTMEGATRAQLRSIRSFGAADGDLCASNRISLCVRVWRVLIALQHGGGDFAAGGPDCWLTVRTPPAAQFIRQVGLIKRIPASPGQASCACGKRRRRSVGNGSLGHCSPLLFLTE